MDFWSTRTRTVLLLTIGAGKGKGGARCRDRERQRERVFGVTEHSQHALLRTSALPVGKRQQGRRQEAKHVSACERANPRDAVVVHVVVPPLLGLALVPVVMVVVVVVVMVVVGAGRVALVLLAGRARRVHVKRKETVQGAWEAW